MNFHLSHAIRIMQSSHPVHAVWLFNTRTGWQVKVEGLVRFSHIHNQQSFRYYAN